MATARLQDLLLNDRELAQRARTALAVADHGVLSVLSGGAEHLLVELGEQGGEPLLFLPANSSAADAARSSQLATVQVNPLPEWPAAAKVRVRLAGRLAILPTSRLVSQDSIGNGNPLLAASPEASTDQVVTATLQVAEIQLGCPAPHLRALNSEYRLPLEIYSQSKPDYLVAHAPWIAEYLTRHHAEQLRSLAARISEQPNTRIAAAWITRLTGSMLQLRYLDHGGGHEFSIALIPPADTVKHLAIAVLAVLDRD